MPTLGSGSESYLAKLKGSNEQSLPSVNPNRPAPASFHVRMPRSAAAAAVSRPNNRLGLSPRGALGSYDELPTTAADSASVDSTDSIPKMPSRNFMRAAEGGKGSLLPDYSAPQQPTRELPNRMSTRSSPSLAHTMKLPGTRGTSVGSIGSNGGGPGLPQTQMDTTRQTSGGAFEAVKQSIRRRAASYLSDDEDIGGGGSSGRRAAASPYRDRRPSRGFRLYQKLQNVLRLKLGHLLQVGIVIAVSVLVWESHHKAMFAAEQLQTFKQEESLLLLHLQKIEKHSLSLHENLTRLAKSGVTREKGGGDSADGGVDFDLIQKQTQQLYQMDEELGREVKSLQERIQQSARSHIIQAFGEGPVQVVLELDFQGLVKLDAGSSRISILLWHDTPHAAWTWLDQITKHIWDGADFAWNEAHVIDAVPHQHQHDPAVSNKIEFVEQGQHSHEPWTVGLKELEDTGTLGMYINLQDNTQYHRHEVCVGKVMEGFDALQKLLEVSRGGGQDGKQHPTIRIKTATAMHVAHRPEGQ
jgi:cyclophilin family peptidyl-prolyl cis-trans isomerase